MPAEMREEVEAKANEAGRSLQQEMLRRIDLSLNLERLFGSRNPSIDAMYAFVADNWKNYHSAEAKIFELEAEINKLKDHNRILTQSTKISDDLRFANLRRNLDVALQALNKAQADLPPLPQPIATPNKKPS
ncbi:hypothetical protein SY86_18820 [Erwinia tracheiphila]|uniref:Arc-like DNA binding domain-containing protein n=2 Tax=Erwinia tracheiphila TaxID=65700 RepID=A0A0M2KIG2_9GAMM|nr:hypothetical protein ETR_12018 [Erwinia tracheiphila PSU-1]KKF37018.1 hypothetical protein SY86_18820 [Erwinia tracheiphila]